jgi:catechol 2,3-dioxygenase-like lactoylglutathione lyase family enzyme
MPKPQTQERRQPVFSHIDHVAIHCSDLERSTAFYRDVMGFEPWVEHHGRIRFFKIGDTLMELTTKSPPEKMSGLHFCLHADDLPAAVAHLRSNGVEFVVEPRPTSPRVAGEDSFKRIMVKGPDGELIEVRGDAPGLTG